MCPNAVYQIGHEKGAGKNGNAPILLYDFLPMELAFIIVPVIVTRTLYQPITMPFTVVGLFVWLVVSLTLAFTIQIVFQGIIRRRFRNP